LIQLSPEAMRFNIESTAEAFGKFYHDSGLGNPEGEPDPVTLEAEIEAKRQPKMHHYAPRKGLQKCIEALQVFSSQIDGVELDDDNIMIGAAGTRRFTGQLADALRNKLGRPPVFVLRKPCYGGHVATIEKAGGICRFVEYEFGKDRYVDRLDEEVVGDFAADVFVHLPVDNPTGEIMTWQETERAVEISERVNAITWFDDAYRYITRGAFPASALRVQGALQRKVVTTNSASKFLRYPGLMSGGLMGDQHVVSQVKAINRSEFEGGSRSAQVGFAAGLNGCLTSPNAIEETRKIYTTLGDRTFELFNEAGWKEVPQWLASIFLYILLPEGWLRAGKNSYEFAMALAQHGIVSYTDLMFSGTGKYIRYRISGPDGSIIRVAEVAHELVRQYA